MAKKDTTPKTRATRKATERKPASRTAGRSRKAAATQVVTHEAIAHRAFEIYLSGSTAGPFGDWVRAERELRV